MDYTTPETSTHSTPAPRANKSAGERTVFYWLRRVLAIISTLIFVYAIICAGHYYELYTLPWLTDTVNQAAVLEASGTVYIDRYADTGTVPLAASAGMELAPNDTVRTEDGSAAWLALDPAKSVGLSGQTEVYVALGIVEKSASLAMFYADLIRGASPFYARPLAAEFAQGMEEAADFRSNYYLGSKGFYLALLEGEITVHIDAPLADGEVFALDAGNIALAVYGEALYTASKDSGILEVSVASGEVTVFDLAGFAEQDIKEIAVLKAGESGQYEAERPSMWPTAIALPAPGTYWKAARMGDYFGAGGTWPNIPADGYGVWTSEDTGTPVYLSYYYANESPEDFPENWLEGKCRYEGEWKDGKPNGQGVLNIYRDAGDTWQIAGAWQDGVPHGQGAITIEHHSDDTGGWKWTCEGTLVNGIFDGPVEETYDAYGYEPPFVATNVLQVEMGKVTDRGLDGAFNVPRWTVSIW